MKNTENMPLVRTITERCRVCYTCVRECPAKAIRIADGQARVIPERCIGCGNCVRVCSQHAKEVLDSIGRVEELLAGDRPVAACLAPSFPAEFADLDHRKLVGMIRGLGFAMVNEVAFGADLVARAYRRLLESNDEKRYIATSCPAIVAFVERYHPELTDSLAPIVSPMVATARALHKLHGRDLRIVFVGPCIAKKGEALSENLPDEVDASLTFQELRAMLGDHGLTDAEVEGSDFDPPWAGSGALFPISRGLLQAAGIREDLIDGQVVAADGRTNFTEAIREFQQGHLDARLLEVLCCNGCIMGAGMSSTEPLFSRRRRVSEYVRSRLGTDIEREAEKQLGALEDLDLSRTYKQDDQRIPVPFEEEIRQIMARMGKHEPDDELNCGACGYDTCREHAVAIFKGLAESEMCLPHTIEKLRTAIEEVAQSHEQLASTRQALLQAEKLASMGQLAAGIAHEVNNPLGVVLMYAHLLADEESVDEKLREDLRLIAGQADRCKKIVAGLLNFARQNKVVLQPANVGELIESTVEALARPENVELRVEKSGNLTAEIDRDQVVQVLVNLVTNALAALERDDERPARPERESKGGCVTLRASGAEHEVRIEVADNGVGIPKENLGKIFEPFFTTKQIGKGTGLGLAVTYGIVKMHRGDIRVESNADPAAGPTGTTFTVTLPRRSITEPETVEPSGLSACSAQAGDPPSADAVEGDRPEHSREEPTRGPQ